MAGDPLSLDTIRTLRESAGGPIEEYPSAGPSPESGRDSTAMLTPARSLYPQLAFFISLVRGALGVPASRGDC